MLTDNVFCILLEIRILENYVNLQVGSTTRITCSVPGIPVGAVQWINTDAWSGASPVSPGVLMLSSVDSTLNGTEFTCSVKSIKLYRTRTKNITITIQGMSNMIYNAHNYYYVYMIHL